MTIHPNLVPRLTTSGAILPYPYVPSWCEEGLPFLPYANSLHWIIVMYINKSVLINKYFVILSTCGVIIKCFRILKIMRADN